MQEPIHLARELARIAREKQLAEIEYRSESTQVRLIFEKKIPPAASAPVAVAEARPQAAQAEAPAPAAPAPGLTVCSPLAGVFYRAPRPGAPPFVEAGASVGAGDTLCIIEAMKLMNELESDVDGVVVAILPQNGRPVEYGEPLFHIKAGA